MKKLFHKRLLLAFILLAIHLTAITVLGQSKVQPKTLPKCTQNPGLGFFPKAFTLTSVNVRTQIPEYSLLRGKWILSECIDTLAQNTCIAIVERKEVGVIQIWYLVKYLRDGELRSGWVWGGTKDVDETQYIGGDKTPEKKENKSSLFLNPSEMPPSILFANVAHAQTDFPPSNRVSKQVATSQCPPGVTDEKAVEYYVKIPFLGWTIRVGVLSAVALFLVMVIGMLAKAFWDQTEMGTVIPPLAKILRPLLISPIAFSAFWTPMYIQQGGAGVSFTMALYAFQIGFMWQHVLEKKATAGTEVGKGNK